MRSEGPQILVRSVLCHDESIGPPRQTVPFVPCDHKPVAVVVISVRNLSLILGLFENNDEPCFEKVTKGH